MNKKRAIVASIVLALVLLVGGILAYFTDTDTATNKFTIGNVNITLTEPKWDTKDSNSNGIPDAAEVKTPGEVIAKDPKITVNDGSNNAYLFLTVEVPAIVDKGTVVKELYDYTKDSSWDEIAGLKKVKSNSVVHVYVYGTNAAPTSTAAGVTTSSLFSNVTVNTTLTNAEVTSKFAAANAANIVVNAYGIQASGLKVTKGEDIFGLFNATL